MSGAVLHIILGAVELREVFKRCLAGSSYRLIFSPDGQDALDRFSEVRPDITLLSAEVARIDAAMVCQLLRQSPHGASTPIVVFSESFTDPRTARDFVEAVGANGYFPVPFEEATLRAVVATYLAHRPSTPTDEIVTDGSLENDFEITLDEPDAEEEFEMDPAIAAAAYASDAAEDRVDEGPDEIPTNPTETPLSPVDLLDEPEAPLAAREHVPVFTRPAGLTPTGPGGGVRVPQSSQPDIPAHLIEPELPSRHTAPVALPDTGQRRIAEVPREVVSWSGASPEPDVDQPRKGLAESQLGKHLVKRVQRTFEQLDEVDYYQLLNLERGATPKQLRDHYFELSLEFHPDRYFLLTSGNLKEKIYAIFRRLNEAHAVLADPRRRARYDEQIDRRLGLRAPPTERSPRPSELAVPVGVPELAVETPSDDARRFITEAQTAFSQEDLAGARLWLSFARVYDPQNGALDAALRRVAQLRRRPGE